MITVTVGDGRITVPGHSGYAPPGQDIVCSAVSTLLQTFIASVERLTLDNIKCNLKAGYAAIEYEEIPSEKTILLERAFLIGINGIAESYPDNLQIIREDAPKQCAEDLTALKQGDSSREM